jgi:hypothetical protein
MGDSNNPYQSQTDQNIQTGWLPQGGKVEVSLNGMAEYAKNMDGVSGDLKSHRNYFLRPMETLTQDAWKGTPMPEALHVQQLVRHNVGELTQLLAWQAVGLRNIAMAAQTVADLYSSTDGWSSADVNAVKFAFGDHSIATPASWPFTTAPTFFYDEYNKQKNAGNDPVPVPQIYHVTQTLHSHDGRTTYQIAVTDPEADGTFHTRIIATETLPDGYQIVTTTVDGKTVSTEKTWYGDYAQETTTVAYSTGLEGESIVTTTVKSTDESQPGRTTGTTATTTTTTTTVDGTTTTTVQKSTGTQVVDYQPGTGDDPRVVTTTDYDGTGKKTSTTVEVTNDDGSTSKKTITYNDKGEAVVTSDVYISDRTRRTRRPRVSPGHRTKATVR